MGDRRVPEDPAEPTDKASDGLADDQLNDGYPLNVIAGLAGDRGPGPDWADGGDGSGDEHALTRGLAVEQLVCLCALCERPAVREQGVDVDVPIYDVPGTRFQLVTRRRPRGHRGDLPVQVLHDVELHGGANSDPAGATPQVEDLEGVRCRG